VSPAAAGAAPRSPEIEPFLRGCVWPPAAGVPYPRCDPGPAGQRLPADTRTAAALPAGVRLEFTGEAEAIEIAYRTETDDFGFRGPGAGTDFVLFRGERRLAAARAALGGGSVRLAAGGGPGRGIVYLPEGMRPTLLGLRMLGGEITPAPPEPRWLCYGDSIAEGWKASEPAWAWPARASRRHALDLVNLGYAGAARGEIASAEEIAALRADLVTVAHGTNCWTRTPHGEAHFAEGLRAFLAIVREGHPRTPIVAVSPILRLDAEDVPNRLGATLADLRRVFERVIGERIASGDERLALVPGHALVPAARLPDGIHPDDAGHALLADAIGPRLGAQLAAAAR
jgi:lysophospholipase L1-like esterase